MDAKPIGALPKRAVQILREQQKQIAYANAFPRRMTDLIEKVKKHRWKFNAIEIDLLLQALEHYKDGC